MLALRDTQQPVDLVILADYLQQHHQLADIAGGAGYIADLMDGVPHINHMEKWVDIVKQCSILRAVIDATNMLQKWAFEGKNNADTIIAQAQEAFASIAARQTTPGEDYRSQFHSFDDFENSPGLTFAIDGFLQTRAATMIAGLSGQSKTFLMLSTVKSLLTGNKLWDLFDVKEIAARVLYLIPESSIGPFKHRLELFGLMEHVRSERLLVRTLSKGPTPLLSDPRILRAAEGADVFLDTAIRFSTEGSENDASDNQRGLATDLFALLGSGGRLVAGAHHAPKSFATQTTMTLENVARGSGDMTAMLATCWGLRQLDQDRNVVYVQNVKARDFQPCSPFQLIGRPYIDRDGDFQVHKAPGESGCLQDELKLGNDKGGAPPESRLERARRVGMVKDWLVDNPNMSRKDVVKKFAQASVFIEKETAKKYISDASKLAKSSTRKNTLFASNALDTPSISRSVWKKSPSLSRGRAAKPSSSRLRSAFTSRQPSPKTQEQSC